MNASARSVSRVIAVAAALGVTVLGACSYTLQGRVIRGEASYAEVVDASDERLTDPRAGIGGVSVHIQADPNHIRRKTLGRVSSGRDGMFSLPVSEFGAGLLDYDIGAFARRQGYEPAEGFFKLPGGSRRLLITLAPGQDRELSDKPDSLQDEFDTRRLLNR